MSINSYARVKESMQVVIKLSSSRERTKEGETSRLENCESVWCITK